MGLVSLLLLAWLRGCFGHVHPATDPVILDAARKKAGETVTIGELDESGRMGPSFSDPKIIREIVQGIQTGEEYRESRLVDNAGSFVLLDAEGKPLFVVKFALASGCVILTDAKLVDGRIVATSGPRNYETAGGRTEHFVMLEYNGFWEAVHRGLGKEPQARPSWGKSADD